MNATRLEPGHPDGRPMVTVGPHEFALLRVFGWRFRERRCSGCFQAESAHPTRHWVVARALGDTRPPGG